MQAWRLTSAAHANDPLSGRGAAMTGGRWNSAGHRMAYASSHRSLAVLEMLVHTRPSSIPQDLVFIPIEIPDRLIRAIASPPGGWDALPWSASARKLGDTWLKDGSSLGLRVPSIVLPAEFNVLLNPLHARFPNVMVKTPEPFTLDRRLFS